MPELPEVETIVRGVRPLIKNMVIKAWDFHRSDLRRPIPVDAIQSQLVGSTVLDVRRRSKYIVIETTKGCAIVHLGMTGNLLFRNTADSLAPHTHFVIHLSDSGGGGGVYLHYIDPRRFGSCSYASLDTRLEDIPEFRQLGPEPLAHDFDLGQHLWKASRTRMVGIKPFLMNAQIVVGVGNIYAAESLFLAGINPKRAAKKVSLARYRILAEHIRLTLKKAIQAGGTTLRDFQNAQGELGYFRIELAVYDRAGEPCKHCKTSIKTFRQCGRSTFYCPCCQKY